VDQVQAVAAVVLPKMETQMEPVKVEMVQVPILHGALLHRQVKTYPELITMPAVAVVVIKRELPEQPVEMVAAVAVAAVQIVVVQMEQMEQPTPVVELAAELPKITLRQY
jgi:hypothetical protein